MSADDEGKGGSVKMIAWTRLRMREQVVNCSGCSLSAAGLDRSVSEDWRYHNVCVTKGKVVSRCAGEVGRGGCGEGTYNDGDVGVLLAAVEDQVFECYTFGCAGDDEVTANGRIELALAGEVEVTDVAAPRNLESELTTAEANRTRRHLGRTVAAVVRGSG